MSVAPCCCQVEEAYHSAEGLCGALGLKADTVLRFEVPLLQGLQFDLVVHSPYRALAGLFKVGELKASPTCWGGGWAGQHVEND